MSKHRRKKKIAKGHCVGSAAKQPLEIDERDRKDYFTPSAEVFRDYCDDVVSRYGLGKMVEQTQVATIDFDYAKAFDLHDAVDPDRKLFKVVTTDGATWFAKIVVLAVGAGGSPIMPRQLTLTEQEGACHSTQLPKQTFLANHVLKRVSGHRPTSIVVVGGGLTSAQIADRCIQDGVTRVFMILRSDLKRTRSASPFTKLRDG